MTKKNPFIFHQNFKFIMMTENQNSETTTSCSSCATIQDPTKITLTETRIGNIENHITNETEPVFLYTWTNTNCMTVSVMTYGATVVSIQIPNRDGFSEDIVLGFDNLEDYIKNNKYYFGATLGRTANITKDAQYECRKICDYVDLSVNHFDGHHVNGGSYGFSNVNWTPHIQGTDLILSYLSKDSEEGYPGNLMTQIKYSITSDNCFKISYSATCDKKTPVNISNRIYINLAGHSGRHAALLEHIFHLNANKYVEMKDSFPTGKCLNVGETNYDFRIPSEIRRAILNRPTNEICDTFIIRKYEKDNIKSQPTFVGRVIHPVSGRAMEIYSTQHCVEFSIATNLPDNNEAIAMLEEEDEEEEAEDYGLEENICDELKSFKSEDKLFMKDYINEMIDKIVQVKMESDGFVPKSVGKKLLLEICQQLKIMQSEENMAEEEEEEGEEEEEEIEDITIYGKEGVIYEKYCGFYLQSENFPNAVNHRNKFPDIMLKPGQNYRQDIIYKFGLHIGGLLPDINEKLVCSCDMINCCE